MRRVVNATADPGTAWEDPQTRPSCLFRGLRHASSPRCSSRPQLPSCGRDRRPGLWLRDLIKANWRSAPSDRRLRIPGPVRSSGGADGDRRFWRHWRSATAVVLPARHEPYPMVIIEAAGCGYAHHPDLGMRPGRARCGRRVRRLSPRPRPVHSSPPWPQWRPTRNCGSG